MSTREKRLILTLHGIRTYGRWQERLKGLVQHLGPSSQVIDVVEYKYGVFTLLSFLVPFLRGLAVKRFRSELEHICETQNYTRIDIVAHSFGTYLAVEALDGRKLADSVKIDTAILCGSVLSPDRNLRRILGPSGRIRRIVNDCGVKDGVLLLTLLVFGVGMAGRLGLSGIQNASLKNRFFQVGHSGYFEINSYSSDPDSFMRTWWLPVLFSDDEPNEHDDRNAAPGLAERMWSALGANGAIFTVSIYSGILAAIASGFAALWLNAVQAQKVAVSQYALALSALSETELANGQAATATRLAILAVNEAQSADVFVPSPVWGALFSAMRENRQRAIFLGHSEFEASAHFSPDGQKVITISNEGVPQIWSLENPSDPFLLKKDDDYVYSAEFSPDGKTVLTSSSKYKARIWRVDGSSPPRTVLENSSEYQFEATFSPDGKWIAFRHPTERNLDRISAVPTDGSRPEVPLRTALNAFGVVPENYEGVFRDKSGGGKPGVYPEDRETGGFHNTNMLSPDGQRAITIPPIMREDQDPRLWSIDLDKEPTVLRGNSGEILFADFNPDGDRVVAASRDGTVRIWDTEKPANPIVLRGHAGRVQRAVFSPTGAHVLTAGQDGTVRVWDTVSSDNVHLLLEHGKPVVSVDFSPKNSQVVTASEDGLAIIWDVEERVALLKLGAEVGGLRAASFDASGNYVLTIGKAGTARVLSSLDGSEVASFGGASERILSATFAPDGKSIATGYANGALKVWSLSDPRTPVVVNTDGNEIDNLVYDPSGKWLLATTDSFADAPPRIWKTSDVGEPAEFIGHNGGAMMGSFNQSGTHFVTASRDRTAIVWSMETNEDPRVLSGHVNYVRSAVFSPDGKRILTASEDFTARIWDIEGDDTPLVLEGHSGIVLSAEFNSDGSRIVTSSGKNGDHTARIWNADGSREPIVLAGHTSTVNRAIFSPNDQWVATASDDGTARIWPVSGSALVRLACSRLGKKGFTNDELKKFAISDPGPICED